MHALQWSDRLDHPYGLNCNDCPRERRCSTWGDSDLSYKHEGIDLLGKTWDRCPASYLNDPALTLAVEIYAATKISPLANWPDGWACWVKDYLIGIDRAIRERKEFDRGR